MLTAYAEIVLDADLANHEDEHTVRIPADVPVIEVSALTNAGLRFLFDVLSVEHQATHIVRHAVGGDTGLAALLPNDAFV